MNPCRKHRPFAPRLRRRCPRHRDSRPKRARLRELAELAAREELHGQNSFPADCTD